MKFIILVRGSDARICPISRKNLLKQFIKLPISKDDEHQSFFHCEISFVYALDHSIDYAIKVFLLIFLKAFFIEDIYGRQDI